MFDEIYRKTNARGVKLVAVSKTQPPERIMELYGKGQRIFGENRVQEMLLKQAALPKDIAWHLIGHLQTNKVKMVAPFVQMIHAVDSLSLLLEIDKQALKAGRCIDCLLQFHIAEEDSKYGFSEKEAQEMLDSPGFANLENIRVCGVMGMATFTEDMAQVRQEFKGLHQIFQGLKNAYFAQQPHFKEISMGMSGDWEIAVEEGSTMVRIGSLIFANP
jgi:PLP dependent protein